MALSEADPADPGDVWFRIATHKDHIRDGKVHHGAFGGNAISVPKREKNRPWDRELSGRLMSQAGSLDAIKSHAEHFCEEQTLRGGGTKKFVGVIYSKVRSIRTSYKSGMSLDVNFTPIDLEPADHAHADLTFHGWNISSKPELEEFTIWLSDQLEALYTSQFHNFEKVAELEVVEALEDCADPAPETCSFLEAVTDNKRAG